MKRTLALITFFLGFGLMVHAQTVDTSSGPARKQPNPSKQAARQLKALQKQLSLTEDQVLQLQVILIQRDVALDSIRRNTDTTAANFDRRAVGRARRSINRDADQKINDLLTAEQKPLYQQWKEEHAHKPAAQKPS